MRKEIGLFDTITIRQCMDYFINYNIFFPIYWFVHCFNFIFY